MTQSKEEMKAQAEAIRTALTINPEGFPDLSTEVIFEQIRSAIADQPQLREAFGILDYVLADDDAIPAELWSNGYPEAIVSTGGSEGIYIDVAIRSWDEPQKAHDFGTFKTLREDFEAYCLMGQIAGAMTRAIEVWQAENWGLLEAAASGTGEGRKVRIGVKAPGAGWSYPMVEDRLENYQKIVGGYIEHVCTGPSGILFFGNEEGKLLGLPANFAWKDDVIVGTVFAVRSNEEGEFESLTGPDMELLDELWKVVK